ncbi:MAG TPA: ATP-binding protein [Acidimicrobiales bacterium]|nr:ATP-binding protein [Acidimicrobiales bacterium]
MRQRTLAEVVSRREPEIVSAWSAHLVELAGIRPLGANGLELRREMSELLGLLGRWFAADRSFGSGQPESERALEWLRGLGRRHVEAGLTAGGSAMFIVSLREALHDTLDREFTSDPAERLAERRHVDRVLDHLTVVGFEAVSAARESVVAERAEVITELNASLDRQTADLERVAFAVAEDLRSPLDTLVELTRDLVDQLGEVDDDTRRRLAEMIEAGSLVQGRIDGLLEYSRLELHGGDTSVWVDSARLVEQALAELVVEIEEADATVTFRHLPAITADGGQITRVFVELITNALRFRGDDDPAVHIDAEDLGDGWVFTVADNGRGVDADARDRVFDMFEHGEHHRAGTGIGLALAAKVVERHGGRIWIEAPDGPGTLVRFELPRR